VATKVTSITGYSREEFYEPFLRFLYEQGDLQHFNLLILEDKSRKPDTILFRSPNLTRDSTIELRPAAKGFDIYVEVRTTAIMGWSKAFSLGVFRPEAQIAAVIAKAASRAKAELAGTPKAKTAEANFCIKCGVSLPLGAIYCPKCGSKQT
jgi:ribosomal protein L40E